MSNENFTSKLLSEAVDQLSHLPGIGQRTALRLALHLLRMKKPEALRFTDTLKQYIEEIQFCKVCHNLTDNEICPICSASNRNSEWVCVVENIKDVMSIERTQQYNGLYHVLGGLISPMEGLGPRDLEIDSLIRRIREGNIREVILALSATLEGDTTNFFIYRKIKEFPIKISTIARGVSFGDELEYTDELTLGKSIVNRIPFEGDNQSN